MHPPRDRRDTESIRKEISVAGYKIGPRLGAGATGTVFAATHPETNQEVAVKIIHRHLAEETTVQEDFLKEISRIAALKHPRILPLEAVGQFDSGEIFVISDVARGLPLTDLMSDSGPLPMAEAIPLLDSLAEILGDLHDQGLVHGNLSPENIWLDPKEDGRWPPAIQILDFGMTMLHRPPQMEDEARSPYYLSPEQIRGEEPTKSTDVYAFGVIAYQMLTGRLPFSSPRLGEVLLMHLNDDPPPPGDIVPMNPETELFLFQALSKDPNYRFKDMHHIRESILPLTQKVSSSTEEDEAPADEPDELARAGATPLLPIEDAPTLASSSASPPEYPVLDDDDIEDGPTQPRGLPPGPPADVVEAQPLPPLEETPIEDGPTPVFTYKSLLRDTPPSPEPDTDAKPEEEEEIEEIDLDQEEEISLDADVPEGEKPLGPVEDDEPTWRRTDAISMADTEQVSGIIQAPEDSQAEARPDDELVIVAEEVESPPPVEERKKRPTPPPIKKRKRRSSEERTVPKHRVEQERPRYALSSAKPEKQEEKDFDLEEIVFADSHVQPPEPQPEPEVKGFVPQQLVPLISALAGILTALSMGVVGYWLATGRWPFPLGQ